MITGVRTEEVARQAGFRADSAETVLRLTPDAWGAQTSGHPLECVGSLSNAFEPPEQASRLIGKRVAGARTAPNAILVPARELRKLSWPHIFWIDV